MANYKVEIPNNRVLRMKKHMLYLEYGDNWNGFETKKYALAEDCFEYLFDINEKFEWAGKTSISDGPNFRVFVECKNSTGSRTDCVELVPVKEGRLFYGLRV